MENIYSVQKHEIVRVMQIIKSAIVRMEEMNIFQWDNLYPDLQTIKTDIEKRNLYGYYSEKFLCGIQTLDTEQPEEYKKIKWEFSKDKSLVIHRLCIDPAFQNKGIAKKLLIFAEEYARKNQLHSIRFDAYENNPISNKIYLNFGYIQRGRITFRKGDFYCYEKEII